MTRARVNFFHLNCFVRFVDDNRIYFDKIVNSPAKTQSSLRKLCVACRDIILSSLGDTPPPFHYSLIFRYFINVIPRIRE